MTLDAWDDPEDRRGAPVNPTARVEAAAKALAAEGGHLYLSMRHGVWRAEAHEPGCCGNGGAMTHGTGPDIYTALARALGLEEA